MIGSSPRARGTHAHPAGAGAAIRVIPACAGNTAWGRSEPTKDTGHPRVRGEHVSSQGWPLPFFGSSPRARGTRLHDLVQLVGGRVIPACAGNTQRSHSAKSTTTGHPRVRGEHIVAPQTRIEKDGSSPRARGTLRGRGQGRPYRRVIPACAGNTAAMQFRRPTKAGHPRVRGEHNTKPMPNASTGGSSPRARGTPAVAEINRHTDRVIPACAGNTPSR